MASVKVFPYNRQIHVNGIPHSPDMPDNGEFTVLLSVTRILFWINECKVD
jgi:hypothetical protein